MPEILTNQVGPEKQFYDFLSDGKIKIQRNKNTGEFFFHPRVAFPGTGERELAVSYTHLTLPTKA